MTTLGAAGLAGLAGCSGSGSGGSDTLDCQSGVVDRGDGDVLAHGAVAGVDGEDVRLVVPLSVESVQRAGVERLAVHDASDDLAYVIPVSAGDASLMANKGGVSEGQLRYEQYLGKRPFHGEYRVVAENGRGEAVDSVTVAFNCFPEVTRSE